MVRLIKLGIPFPRKLFFFKFNLMYCDLWCGNYSRAETIRGNTVFQIIGQLRIKTQFDNCCFLHFCDSFYYRHLFLLITYIPRGKDTKVYYVLAYNLLKTELEKVLYLLLFYCKDWSLSDSHEPL